MASVDYDSSLNEARTNAEQSETGGDFRVSFESVMLDPYVSSFLDRHGKRRWRFRRGKAHVYIPNPSSPEYAPAYAEALDLSELPHTEGSCYFIGALGVNVVKIGYAGHVRNRLSHMQVNSPVRLELLATAPGGLLRERLYHRRFKAHRLHGEWFERCPEIEAEIDRLANA
jgi:hypothetical protein